MKTRVRFPISNPIAFTTNESYSTLGIETDIVDGKLAAIQTTVEHDPKAGHEDIKFEAQSNLTRLLSLLEYGCGIHIGVGDAQFTVIDPESEVTLALAYVKLNATLIRQVPMPPAGLVANLSEDTRLQADWYILGMNSISVTERIKYLYYILEAEQRVTPTYTPPQTLTYLRHAVSHEELTKTKAATYLQSKIGSSKLDPKNDEHMRFLERELPGLELAARNIIEAKVPSWW